MSKSAFHCENKNKKVLLFDCLSIYFNTKIAREIQSTPLNKENQSNSKPRLKISLKFEMICLLLDNSKIWDFWLPKNVADMVTYDVF